MENLSFNKVVFQHPVSDLFRVAERLSAALPFPHHGSDPPDGQMGKGFGGEKSVVKFYNWRRAVLVLVRRDCGYVGRTTL